MYCVLHSMQRTTGIYVQAVMYNGDVHANFFDMDKSIGHDYLH